MPLIQIDFLNKKNYALFKIFHIKVSTNREMKDPFFRNGITGAAKFSYKGK